jgi:hypothetical protein
MIWLARLALLVAGPAWTGPAGTEISKMEEQIAKLQADLAALAARVTALEGGPPAPTTYPVTLTTGGTGSGTVGFLGAPRRGTRTTREYAAGKIVTLTALPASGSTFTGWSPAPCAPTFTMPAYALTCLGTFTATVVTPPPTGASSERLPTGPDAMSTFRELHAGAVQHVLGLQQDYPGPTGLTLPTLPVVAPPRLKGIGSASGLTGRVAGRLASGAGSR